MPRLILSKNFVNCHKKIIRSNQSLKNQSRKTIEYLSKDLKHSSLRIHKLKNLDYWSIYVNKSIRIIIKIDGDDVYLIDIGKHEDVY